MSTYFRHGHSVNEASSFINENSTIEISWTNDGVGLLCEMVNIDMINAKGEIIYKIGKDVPFSDLKIEYTVPPLISLGEEIAFRVSCSDYECFSFFNTSEFKGISGSCVENFTEYYGCNIRDITANVGSNSLFMDLDLRSGSMSIDSFYVNLSPNDSPYKFIRNSISGQCQEVKFSSGNNLKTPHQLFRLNVSERGEYIFRSRGEFSALYVFDLNTYNSDNPCASLIGANVWEDDDKPGTTSTAFSSSLRVNLMECTDYYLAITDFSEDEYYYDIYPNNFSAQISIESEFNQVDFSYLVMNENKAVIQVLDRSDFRGLPAGTYHILPFSSQYDEAEEDLYLGLTINEINSLPNQCNYYGEKMFQLTLIEDADEDGYNSNVDCDDYNSEVNPGAEEIANNDIDENCDGELLIIDNDQDGYHSDEDCDDENPNINPGVEEIANNDIDENCDGEALIIDNDQDGYNSDEDCNDEDALVNPGVDEIANNDIDENCDGELLIIDNDQDGFNSDEDCDDENSNINPNAEEVANNEIDENCDGELLVIDNDQDGYNSDEDCDDENSAVNPGAEEIANNELDENCDGEVLVIDNDQDGFNSDEDCDDNNPDINPEAEEIVNNGIDENCDGEDLTSGLQDLDPFDVTIYPNPVIAQVNIKSSLIISEISIFNLQGQCISKNLVNNKTHNLDMEFFALGVYFIKIKSREEGNTIQYKLLKM